MLIERDAELSALRALLHDAVAGKGQLAAVSGEAGIGKTTLVSHLVRSCPQEVAVRRGTAHNVPAAAALGVVLDALPELRAEAGQVTRTTRLELFRRIRSILGRPADGARSRGPALGG